jgi:hypothetical protein
MKKIRIQQGNIKGQGKPMCGGESFKIYIFIRFIPLFFYSLSFYYFMSLVLGKLVCVKWEKRVILV